VHAFSEEEGESEELPQVAWLTWQDFKETMYDHHPDLIFLITEYLCDNTHCKFLISTSS
jgi:hypothetical protein